MPNFSTGWSASSLTPAARAVVNNANMASPAASPTVQNLLNNAAQANPYGTTQVSGATNNLLAAIYGPNYQSLLQSKTAGDGGSGNVDSEFQKQMTNFLFQKSAAMQGARNTTQSLEWDAQKRGNIGIQTGLGMSTADQQKLAAFDRVQQLRKDILPAQTSVAKMAAYTPNFGSTAAATQQPNISGWTPAGMAWMPQQQPSAATQAGMQLTGMQRPNYAQNIMNNQGQQPSVASTWQSRLMSQGMM
jgi:hypothetical protein